MSNENNSRPLFAVGEEVILQSIKNPIYNGEYTVDEVIQSNRTVLCRITGNRIYCEHLTYRLNLPIPHIEYDDGTETLWCESALRKKYQGSEFGFTELMSVLKSPAPITA